MNIFREVQKRVVSARTKKQSAYYKKLQRSTQVAKLKREKLERLRDASKAKRNATRELQASKPLKRKPRFNFVGDFNKFAGKLPSDEELNQTIFGSSQGPRRPK